MRPALAIAVLLGCTPPAATVGGWTSAAGSSDSTSNTVEPSSSSTSSSSSSSSSSGSVTSSSSGDDSSSSTTAAATAPPWVATIVGDGPVGLRVIDLEHGTLHDVCTLADVVRVDALAFLPDDRLIGSDAATQAVWVADPCDCALTPVVPLEPPLSLHAMAEAIESATPTAIGVDGMRGGLFGAEVDVPLALVLAELPLASSITALAAASEGSELFALADIDGMHLLRIGPASGTIASDVAVDLPGHTTGLTLAPDHDSLLACDDDGTLWRIESDGSATAPLDIQLTAPCRTLAAPHGTVECIDALLEL